MLSCHLFYPAFVQMMADFFTLEANEIEPIDAFIYLFTVEDSLFYLLYPNPHEVFIIAFYPSSSNHVARKLPVFDFIFAAIVNVLVSSISCRSPRSLLFSLRHLFYFLL